MSPSLHFTPVSYDCHVTKHRNFVQVLGQKCPEKIIVFPKVPRTVTDVIQRNLAHFFSSHSETTI